MARKRRGRTVRGRRRAREARGTAVAVQSSLGTRARRDDSGNSGNSGSSSQGLVAVSADEGASARRGSGRRRGREVVQEGAKTSKRRAEETSPEGQGRADQRR